MHMQVFTKRYKQGIWDVRAMVDSGGMPSSHSALTAVSTVPTSRINTVSARLQDA